jgi:hypothetical protein
MLAMSCLLLLAAFGAIRLVRPDAVTAPAAGVSAAPPVSVPTMPANAIDPAYPASTPAPSRAVLADAEDAPPVESAPAPRFEEHAERLSLEVETEPVLGEDESSVAIAEPLRVEERVAAQAAREAEIDAAIPAPPPAPALRRADVLAQPSPRRDLAARRFEIVSSPDDAVDAEPDADSVPIARRDRAPRPSSAAVRNSPVPETRIEAPAPSVAGTVWHPDAARRSARLRVAGDERIRDVREGDRISGGQVMRIDPSGVLLRRGELETLRRVGEKS